MVKEEIGRMAYPDCFAVVLTRRKKAELYPGIKDFNQISSGWVKCRYWQDMFSFRT